MGGLVILALLLMFGGHHLASLSLGPIVLVAVAVLGIGWMVGGRRACGPGIVQSVVGFVAFLVIAAFVLRHLLAR